MQPVPSVGKFTYVCKANNCFSNHTHRYRFQILLNYNKLGLQLQFSEWFGINLNSIWNQINRESVITIQFWVELTRFRKDFSVCRWRVRDYGVFSWSNSISVHINWKVKTLFLGLHSATDNYMFDMIAVVGYFFLFLLYSIF